MLNFDADIIIDQLQPIEPEVEGVPQPVLGCIRLVPQNGPLSLQFATPDPDVLDKIIESLKTISASMRSSAGNATWIGQHTDSVVIDTVGGAPDATLSSTPGEGEKE